MNQHTTHNVRGSLARFSRRVAAIVAECNYAEKQMISLEHTPERF
jgi:hypothetical protein